LQNSDKAGGTHTHTQQEIADAVGVNPTDKCLRLSGNLDTCPKNQKLAALFEEAMVLPDLDKCPKSVKIAALFEEAMIISLVNLDRCPKLLKIAARARRR